MSYSTALLFFQGKPVDDVTEQECRSALNFLVLDPGFRLRADPFKIEYPGGYSITFEGPKALLTFLAKEHKWGGCWFIQQISSLVREEARYMALQEGTSIEQQLNRAAIRMANAYFRDPDTRRMAKNHFDPEIREIMTKQLA